MDSDLLPLISRWLHIIPAIILVGGTLFMRLALAPVASAAADSETAELRESIRRKWAKWVMISTALLLISGLYNAYLKAIGFHMSGTSYNGLLLVKIVLAFAVFYLSAILSGRSQKAIQFRQSETKWLNILCALMLAIVLIAGYMKMSSANFEKKVRGGDTIEEVTPTDPEVVPAVPDAA
jgi:uncharacterized membrane protein